MNKNLDVVEDTKQNITDNQYKTILESLMEIRKEKEDIVKDNITLDTLRKNLMKRQK